MKGAHAQQCATSRCTAGTHGATNLWQPTLLHSTHVWQPAASGCLADNPLSISLPLHPACCSNLNNGRSEE